LRINILPGLLLKGINHYLAVFYPDHVKISQYLNF
jgi:hypothetical protein